MSPGDQPPSGPGTPDYQALRSLAVVTGGIIAAAWLVLDEVHAQLLLTGVLLAILVAALLAVYLLRRWRNRR